MRSIKKMAWVAQHTQVELMVEPDHSKLTLLQRLTIDGVPTSNLGGRHSIWAGD